MRLHPDTSILRPSAALAAPVPYGPGRGVSPHMPVNAEVGRLNRWPHHQYALVRRPMR
jgi:hypothetical protein